MISYQSENWFDVLPELKPLFPKHWDEIARHHDKVPLDIDYPRYAELAEKDVLHVATARDDGNLIGYQVTMVTTHLHYSSTLHAITDVYFLLPEYRKGRIGSGLFRFIEQELSKRVPKGGYLKLYTGIKLHFEQGRVSELFQHLGYEPTETLLTKVVDGTGE